MCFSGCANETVSAVRNGSAISLHLSTQVALKLGLRLKAEDRLGVAYGSGEDSGKLRLGRTRLLDGAIHTYPICGGVGLNLNPKFIFDAALPPERVLLPHNLRGHYVLIDLSPLRTKI